MAKLWHHRSEPRNDSPSGSSSLERPTLAPAPRPENFLAQPYKRARSRSKREKDKARQDFRLERQRLLKEAFYDNIQSIGEVDALTGSERLTVDRGDVLRDPKVKGYQHPALAVKWRPADSKRRDTV
jgi:hypothetical protein